MGGVVIFNEIVEIYIIKNKDRFKLNKVFLFLGLIFLVFIIFSKAVSVTSLSIEAATKTANTWYLVTIPAKAFKDYSSNNLLTNYTFKFKTGI